jgi:hypothetical protein
MFNDVRFTCLVIISAIIYLVYRMSEKSGSNGNFIYYLFFMLYALYVHPDTLRIFSADLPCLCADFAQHFGIDSSTTVSNSLPKVTKISDFNIIHLCLQEYPK